MSGAAERDVEGQRTLHMADRQEWETQIRDEEDIVDRRLKNDRQDVVKVTSEEKKLARERARERWTERMVRERAEAKGRRTSAAEHYVTGALCHHYGKFLFVQDVAQMRVAHARAVELHTRALPWLSPPGERVLVPFGDTSLAGVLRRPAGVARPPVVLLVSGLDSTKEEAGPHEAALLARGIATLAFDGPGQGEAEYDLPLRHDYEVPVGAVIDLLESRDDVDAARVGLWGRSLGGHLVVRAAAFEPRVRACVSLSGSYRVLDTWEKRPGLNRMAYVVRSHSSSEEEAAERLAAFDLAGVTERVTCPMYVVGGTADRLTSHEVAVRIAAEVRGPVELNVIEGGTHTGSNKPYAYRPEAADWLTEVLSA
jgi:2,6-dihydroxypseudooxynicotine hydrolase